MSWSTLIVDDEFMARKNLELMLETEPDIALLPSVSNATRALETIRTETVDLVFLDIRMPGKSGIDLLRDLGEEERVPFVVLVTAFDSYALEAFALDARDYLVKPFGEARLQKTLARARDQLEARSAQDVTRILRAAAASEPEPKRLVLEVDGGVRLIDPTELIWIEAADHYLILHTIGENAIVRMPLRELASRLPDFLRIHRSTLVNPDHVDACARKLRGPTLTLRDGTTLPVSRRRWPEIRARLGDM